MHNQPEERGRLPAALPDAQPTAPNPANGTSAPIRLARAASLGEPGRQTYASDPFPCRPSRRSRPSALFSMNHSFRLHARAGLAAAAAAFALASCSDSPGGPTGGGGGGGGGALAVAITASMTQPSLLRAPVDPAATLDCTLVLHGKATGTAGATGQWGKGVFRFFAGPQRDVPIDSFTVSAEEIRQSWDVP